MRSVLCVVCCVLCVICYVVEWGKRRGRERREGGVGEAVWCGDWFRLVWSDWVVPSIASFWGLVPSLLFPSGWCSTLSSPFCGGAFPLREMSFSPNSTVGVQGGSETLNFSRENQIFKYFGSLRTNYVNVKKKRKNGKKKKT